MFLRVHIWPILFGLAFSGLAIQWAFILDTPGRGLNRENLLGLFWVWMILFIISVFQKRWRDSLVWVAAPMSYVLVLTVCRLSVASQVEEARFRGESLMARAKLYAESKGEFPSSLSALSGFDGIPIPRTGIEMWGSKERVFYFGSLDFSSVAYDNYEGVAFYLESPYRTEFWIGFQEYGFQEHKLRVDADWDTYSGSGDYLVGKIDLRW